MKIIANFLCTLGVALLLISTAMAQVTVPGQPLVPLGYCQLSVDAATPISACSPGVPSGATLAYLTAEAQAIRYRDDGTAPTAAIGQPLAKDVGLLYAGPVVRLRFIGQTAGAKVNILFYRAP